MRASGGAGGRVVRGRHSQQPRNHATTSPTSPTVARSRARACVGRARAARAASSVVEPVVDFRAAPPGAARAPTALLSLPLPLLLPRPSPPQTAPATTTPPPAAQKQRLCHASPPPNVVRYSPRPCLSMAPACLPRQPCPPDRHLLMRPSPALPAPICTSPRTRLAHLPAPAALSTMPPPPARPLDSSLVSSPATVVGCSSSYPMLLQPSMRLLS